MNSAMGDFESSQEAEVLARETAFNTELQGLKKEKAEIEEKIKNLQEEADKQVVALETVQGNGPDLQAQYLELVLQRNEAREARDRIKEEMDRLGDCPEKREAKILYAELYEKVENLDKKIDVSLQMAKDKCVPITLYEEPEVDDTYPNMIKRITMLSNVGNVGDIDRLRNDRDRLS